ncbi:MAG: hypothetical protein IKB07_08245 [Lachnospiraceae bacterium]|nr:hypothetical protein [Lachnospiraceae bacterium]
MASDREDGKTVYEIRVGFNMGGQTIGRYGTEERAKEVLEEFIEYCMIVKDYYSGVCHTADDMEPYREMKFGCYDMPAE